MKFRKDIKISGRYKKKLVSLRTNDLFILFPFKIKSEYTYFGPKIYAHPCPLKRKSKRPVNKNLVITLNTIIDCYKEFHTYNNFFFVFFKKFRNEKEVGGVSCISKLKNKYCLDCSRI